MRRRGQRVVYIPRRQQYNIDPETGHEEGMNCWCHPAVLHVFANGEPMIVHRDQDGNLPDIDDQIAMIAEFANVLYDQQEAQDDGDDDAAVVGEA